MTALSSFRRGRRHNGKTFDFAPRAPISRSLHAVDGGPAYRDKAA
jgi:hypothetical protein